MSIYNYFSYTKLWVVYVILGSSFILLLLFFIFDQTYEYQIDSRSARRFLLEETHQKLQHVNFGRSNNQVKTLYAVNIATPTGPNPLHNWSDSCFLIFFLQFYRKFTSFCSKFVDSVYKMINWILAIQLCYKYPLSFVLWVVVFLYVIVFKDGYSSISLNLLSKWEIYVANSE